VFLSILLASVWGISQGRASSTPAPFVIDPNRAFVYLRFDHIGKGVKFFEDEPSQRLWLRFVNNCREGIVLSTFGPPEGALANEAGVMYEVVKDAPIELVDLPNNDSNVSKSSDQKETNMPRGYSFDVGSASIISPGKSLLFSIPINHLGKSWHIEIPFEFKLPPGKGSRPLMIGGEPHMVLVYSIEDLPLDIQKKTLEVH